MDAFDHSLDIFFLKRESCIPRAGSVSVSWTSWTRETKIHSINAGINAEGNVPLSLTWAKVRRGGD